MFNNVEHNIKGDRLGFLLFILKKVCEIVRTLEPEGSLYITLNCIQLHAVLSLERVLKRFYVMFKNRAAVLSGDKTRAARFLNGFKNIPQKASVVELPTEVQIVRGRY